MYKDPSPNSTSLDLKARLPRINQNLNCFSTAISSPSSSVNSSYSHKPNLPSKNRSIMIPRLNTRPVLSSKARNLENNHSDHDSLDEYM